MKYTFFNLPNEENGIISPYNNLHFFVNNQKFYNIYQYLIYKKALFFEDTIIAQKILNTSDIKLIKFYNNIIKTNSQNKNLDDFNNKLVEFLLEGLKLQVNQNYELYIFIKTNNNYIYCDLHDKILSIGYDIFNAKFNQDKWGSNLYGRSLDIIKNNLDNYNIANGKHIESI